MNLVRSCAGLLLGTLCAAASAAPLAPGQGVRFQQQQLVLPGAPPRATRTGTLEVDLPRLRQASGRATGWLNVATARGWVVRNLPVPAEDSYPYGKLSVDFAIALQDNSSTASITASVDYGDTVLESYSVVDAGVSYGVEPITLVIGGAGTTPVTGAAQPPDLTSILLGDPRDNDTVIQYDHPNIEAAQNACMPTAVANSLQFLENTQGLPIPHDHKPGLKPGVSAGDDSLVGRVEDAMGRAVTDRRTGQGTWGLQGKLRYLAGNGLASRVQVRHWGAGGAGATNGNPDSGGSDVSVSVGGASITSRGSGGKPNVDQLLEAMRDGQNCEAVYGWSGGRHAVDLVAVGKTRGQPWIIHSSDLDQSSDSAGAGPSGLKFEYLSDTDGDGLLNLSGTDKQLEQVICEKALPPPASVTVVERIDPAGHACCTQAPPSTLGIVRSGSTLTLTGGTAWLPLTGTLSASGRFELSSTATIAGFSNVRSTFSGEYANGVYSGTLSIGTRGELFGVPISYRLRVTEAGTASAAAPAMRINGFRQAVTLGTRDAVKVSISLRAAAAAGRAGDWWLAVTTADGQWFHYDLARQSWQPGLAPTYSGPLFDIAYFGLPTLDGLPAGSYAFFFGFDGAANGVLDTASAVYERTVLTVRP